MVVASCRGGIVPVVGGWCACLRTLRDGVEHAVSRYTQESSGICRFDIWPGSCNAGGGGSGRTVLSGVPEAWSRCATHGGSDEMKRFVSAAVTLVCIGVVMASVTASPADAGTNGCPPDGKVYGVAHQGAHDSFGTTTFRNTLPAFKKAQDRCQWVESDVRFTSDMIPVMAHDATTGRMFRYRCDLVVADSTLAELRAACRNPDGSTIATFDQYLSLVSQRGQVEIKPGATSDQKLKILIVKIYAHHDADVVSLEYHDEALLHRIAALDNDADPISRVWKGAYVASPDRVADACEYALYNYRKFTADMVQRLSRLGVQSISGSTPTEPSKWNYLVSVGAHAVMTDDSKKLFDWQNSR